MQFPRIGRFIYKVLAIGTLLFVALPTRAQFLMDMLDTSKMTGKNLLGIYEKYNYLTIIGYMQPQF
ncbi:MAG TPA: hypothetical protein PLQ32_08020, partial [Flavihumibacter sp.]|nr:hypothetical protein [Flavihumibacter sp.]